LLIAQGASVKAVQAQLGHASATVTLDRYGHLFPDELQQLAERLQEAYADAVSDPARTETAQIALQIRKEAGQGPTSRGGPDEHLSNRQVGRKVHELYAAGRARRSSS
jgi:hypothetical protein